MGETDNIQPPTGSPRIPEPKGDDRARTRWEKQVEKWLRREDELLRAFQKVNGTDFVMSGMLAALKELRDGIGMAKRAFGNTTDAAEQKIHVDMLLRMNKQEMDILKTIAKFMETTYHASVKARRGNKSAAPGQIVAMAPAPSPAASQAQP